MDFKAGDNVLVEAEVVSKDSLDDYEIRARFSQAPCIVNKVDTVWVPGRYIHPTPTKTYEDGKWWMTFWEEDGGVIAWMPLPAPETSHTYVRDRKQLHVGDVVQVANGRGACVVTHVNKDMCRVLWPDGICRSLEFRHVAKTGRHIDIKGFLEQIGGEHE